MTVRARTRTLKIDGRDIAAHEEQTILELAQENGIFIPTLCRLEGLSIIGACRLCMVEVKGWNKIVPACATYADEGMDVLTNTQKLRNYRRQILEMLFSEGNHVCAVCVSNGNCELQSLAQYLGMDHVRYPNLEPNRQVDMSHSRFVLDRNRCVLCARCVRVCDEIEGAHVWDFKGRGVDTRVITDLDIHWGESKTCTSCGKCVNVCPVGAIVEKGRAVGEMKKRHEFLPYLSKMREAKK